MHIKEYLKCPPFYKEHTRFTIRRKAQQNYGLQNKLSVRDPYLTKGLRSKRLTSLSVYRQYTNLSLFRFLSVHCLRSTLYTLKLIPYNVVFSSDTTIVSAGVERLSGDHKTNLKYQIR